MPSVIGLDIGSSAIRAVQVSGSRRGLPVLERVAAIALPSGAIRDGEVVDPDLVAMALRDLWRTAGFKNRRVALGIANQQVVVRQVDLPYLPEKDLRASLSFQVEDAIPIPIDQAILDFHSLDTFENSEGERFSRILLVAAQRDMVDQLMAAVTQAKLEPVLVDLSAFAMLRSLAPESSRGLLDEPAGELLVNVGSAVTNLLIHDGGEPRFVRILLTGGDIITEGLMQTLGIEREEAEQRKIDTGLLDPTALLEADQDARVIAERTGRLLDEIRGSLNFYSSQVDAVPVKRVILSGGAGRLRGLRERLADLLELPVEPGHPMQELRIGSTGLTHEELVGLEANLTVAVGLALGAAQ